MAFSFLTNHPIPVPLYIHNNNCRFCNWVCYFIWVWNWAVKCTTTGFTHIVKLLYSNQTRPFKIHMHFSAVWLRASLEKIKIKQSERDKTTTKTNKKISIFFTSHFHWPVQRKPHHWASEKLRSRTNKLNHPWQQLRSLEVLELYRLFQYLKKLIVHNLL